MSNNSKLKPHTKEEKEPVLDKKMIDNYFTMVLQKRFKTADKASLEKAVESKGIRMRIISTLGPNGYDNYLTVSDKQNKILGQIPAKLFIKQ